MRGAERAAHPTQRPVAAKVCGLTRVADAAYAEAIGAAYLGVILASGPRLVDPATAAAVLGEPRPGVQRVAVLGAQSPAEIVHLTHVLRPDIVQLHGDHDVAAIRRVAEDVGCVVWPVLRVVGAALPLEQAVALAGSTGWLVLDAKVPGKLGGSGVALDWSGLREPLEALRRRVPDVRVVLAGGLTPTNVQEAMMLLSPDVMDVSSGVEMAPGVKDPVKVEQFVRAVNSGTQHDQ